MDRDVHDIASKIEYIIKNYCNNEENKSKWLLDLSLFFNIDKDYTKLFKNKPPEYILDFKWNFLNDIVNKNIHEHIVQLNDYEYKIINILTNKENNNI